MKFFDSAEVDFGIAGAGALTGVYTTPLVVKALSKYGPLAISAGEMALGVVAFVVGAYAKNNHVSAFAIGAGVSYFVEGLLRFALPNNTYLNSVAAASIGVNTSNSAGSGAVISGGSFF
jgi:hypothetical protein